jgi:hypothetical protein
MPTEQIVDLLIAERDKLNRAIEALQGPAKRRGRPPRNLAVVAAPAAATVLPDASSASPKRKRRRFTAAQRKAFGDRMKAYWAAKRKTKSKTKTA